MEVKAEKVSPLKKAYPFAEEHGLADEARKIRDMDVEWDRPYNSSVRRGFMIELFQRHGLLTAFKDAHWRHGLTQAGQTEERRCLKIKAEFDAHAGCVSPGSTLDVPEDGDEASEQFALESHLRDFLAKHPERLEAGLHLHSTPDNEGVEYPVDDGRIDILSVDRNGKFVIVELKVSRGRNKALGQLLYYMGWIDKNLGNGPCRGVIVANEITEDLITAVYRVSGVTLYRYRMNFSVEQVAS